uniref:RNA polymerase beta' subunit n=1 Tax=Symbiochloris sp. SG-2018 TaxID=2126034 RepID=UPI0021155325|nr:RNA polymerase beta' subunit [Symbiochloris sp. SG-2018]UTQ75747.1 RNA polymerase beta' subunit [Symbiochloris sp. SG-2018]
MKKTNIESLGVGLASPEQIRQWAERVLPNGKVVGQVMNAQTVNYKTLRPERGGLFCERIFGPVKDYECACGKIKPKSKQKFCFECEVESISSRVRRYRLGYIRLSSPIAHIWYFKGNPSYISTLLNLPTKQVEAVIYCTKNLSMQIGSDYYYHEQIENNQNENSQKMTLGKRKRQRHTISLKSESRSANGSVGARQTIGLMYSAASLQKNSSLSLDSSTRHLQCSCSKNNYYTISQNFYWDSHEDWKAFLNYMTEKPQTHDIPISFYNCKNSENQRIQPTNIPLTGGGAIQNLISNFNGKDLRLFIETMDQLLMEYNQDIKDLEELMESGFFQPGDKFFYKLYEARQGLCFHRRKLVRRLKFLKFFHKSQTQPEWMILSALPVLPPDLRPIIKMDGNQVAISDINKLYQKVLFRDQRLNKFRQAKYSINTSIEMRYAHRLLQESVDAVIANGKGTSVTSNQRPLKSLSDILKGKKGRFRQNLLGKRVDYSGRSVIVVGPQLKLHECGLPKEMAVELFQPFLIRRLITNQFVQTVLGAKRLIQSKEPIIWQILHQVLKNHPILLNRAPTLHRLSFQAFQPKLVAGRAILLHPLVCSAFNADFDGDQMAVHVPLSFEARAEAWKLMCSRNNLLSPATGQPVLVPSQDMVLGCYYLTTTTNFGQQNICSGAPGPVAKKPEITKSTLKLNAASLGVRAVTTTMENRNESETDSYIDHKLNVSIHNPIWIKWDTNFETVPGRGQNLPVEIRIALSGYSTKLYPNYLYTCNTKQQKQKQIIRTTPGRVVFNQMLKDTLNGTKYLF